MLISFASSSTFSRFGLENATFRNLEKSADGSPALLLATFWQYLNVSSFVDRLQECHDDESVKFRDLLGWIVHLVLKTSLGIENIEPSKRLDYMPARFGDHDAAESTPASKMDLLTMILGRDPDLATRSGIRAQNGLSQQTLSSVPFPWICSSVSHRPTRSPYVHQVVNIVDDNMIPAAFSPVDGPSQNRKYHSKRRISWAAERALHHLLRLRRICMHLWRAVSAAKRATVMPIAESVLVLDGQDILRGVVEGYLAPPPQPSRRPRAAWGGSVYYAQFAAVPAPPLFVGLGANRCDCGLTATEYDRPSKRGAAGRGGGEQSIEHGIVTNPVRVKRAGRIHIPQDASSVGRREATWGTYRRLRLGLYEVDSKRKRALHTPRILPPPWLDGVATYAPLLLSRSQGPSSDSSELLTGGTRDLNYTHLPRAAGLPVKFCKRRSFALDASDTLPYAPRTDRAYRRSTSMSMGLCISVSELASARILILGAWFPQWDGLFGAQAGGSSGLQVTNSN
ncbi:hypothetical protein K438DRAFT_1755703 [Mycena galopus ATCC 62051]|nr:hypothetical protein K438DRAFT_1755703 [Mycena galopus ATCC 62051]